MKKVILGISLIFFLFISFNCYAMNYGIGKTNNGKRPYPGKSYDNLISSNGGYYIGADTSDIYLTFDCGYENGYTKSILETLKANNVKAIFFITGHYLTSATDIVKQMIDDGHIIGNHSYNHKNFSKISSSEMLHEIKLLEDKYKELFNKDMSKFVRPPEGAIDEENAKVLAYNGYISLYWSLAYVDWYKDTYNSNHYSYNNVIPRLHNGAIILMHTVSKDNMMDLSDIIVKSRSLGYEFSSVNKLI